MIKLFKDMTREDWNTVSCCGDIDLVQGEQSENHLYVCGECGKRIAILHNTENATVEVF